MPLLVERGVRGGGERAVLVAVAEQDLAGGDVAPAARAVGLAVAGTGGDAGALDGGLGDAVEEAEVVAATGERLGALEVHERHRVLGVGVEDLEQRRPEVVLVDRPGP